MDCLELDQELTEYLKLIDATVTPSSLPSVPSNSHPFLSQSMQDQRDMVVNGRMILDDSALDWNCRSNLTTMESPKSQEDLQEIQPPVISEKYLQHNTQSTHQFVQQNPQLQIPSLKFQPILRNEFGYLMKSGNSGDLAMNNNHQPLFISETGCLCNLECAQKPSRSLVIRLGLKDDLSSFLRIALNFGEIQNIDRHKFSQERTVIISFYNILSSQNAFSYIQSKLPQIAVSYLIEFNDFDFIDYIIVSNSDSFNLKALYELLSVFGQILDSSQLNDKLLLKYQDVRSLKSIMNMIKLGNEDRAQFSQLYRSRFPPYINEAFVLEVLKQVVVFSKDNSTDMILKSSPNQQQIPFPTKQTSKFNLFDNETQDPPQFQSSLFENIPFVRPQLQPFGFQSQNCNKMPDYSGQLQYSQQSNEKENQRYLTSIPKQLSYPAQQMTFPNYPRNQIPFPIMNENGQEFNTFRQGNYYPQNTMFEGIPQNQNYYQIYPQKQENSYQQYINPIIDQPKFEMTQQTPTKWVRKDSQQGTQKQSNIENTIISKNNPRHNQRNEGSFSVNIDNILNKKDSRSTLMVRNIPNRYNQESFLQIIDINFKGLYDFVYLPMDFKNHCNIGYAFINFTDPKHIVSFDKEFNGKRWELIRSEKVCSLCYARIQGRNELISHFKKSGVMNAAVEKSFKPLILPNPSLDHVIPYN